MKITHMNDKRFEKLKPIDLLLAIYHIATCEDNGRHYLVTHVLYLK